MNVRNTRADIARCAKKRPWYSGWYFWQFIYMSDSQRLPRIASLSLMFSSNISIAIAKLGRLFEPNKNVIGMVTKSAIQIMGLLLMIIVFSLGFYHKKRSLDMN